MKKRILKSVSAALCVAIVFSFFTFSDIRATGRTAPETPQVSGTVSVDSSSKQAEVIKETAVVQRDESAEEASKQIRTNSVSEQKKDESTIRYFTKYVSDVGYWFNFLKSLGTPIKGLSFSSIDAFKASAEKVMYNYLNLIAQQAVDVICALYPDPGWQSIDEYDGKDFYSGRENYLTEAQQGAKWQLGYSSESVIPADFKSGKYYMGGSLQMFGLTATEVHDDQRVRAICVDDSSGNGAVVVAAIDALGMSSTDIREVRSRLANFAKENNIVSINISSTHSHSCLDVQGVSSPFIYTLVGTGINNEYNIAEKLPFMNARTDLLESVYNACVKAIKSAYNNMESGEFCYSTADATQFLRDKREPISFEKNICSLRFVPDNSQSEGTYLINFACHPTSLPHTTNTVVSSDYIYYMEKAFNEAGYNFVLVQGALGAITRDTSTIELPENATRFDTMEAFGRSVAGLVLNIDKKTEIKLDPILNAKHEEFFGSCDNKLLMLACRCELVNNKVYLTGKKHSDAVMATEVGYVEFGGKVAFGLMPGELYPEVSVGGAADAQTSWTNTSWDYPPLKSMVKNNLDFYCVSLANDAIGYVVTDNNFGFLAPDHQPDELLSAGPRTASQLVTAFGKLLDDTYGS